VEWVLWVLVLFGGAGFLLALVIATPLVTRGVSRWVLPTLGGLLFLAYFFALSVWGQEVDVNVWIMLSPLQLVGWFAGAAVAGWLVRLRRERNSS
jgi:hypothetical protein